MPACGFGRSHLYRRKTKATTEKKRTKLPVKLSIVKKQISRSYAGVALTVTVNSQSLFERTQELEQCITFTYYLITTISTD